MSAYRVPVTYDAPEGFIVLRGVLHGFSPVIIYVPIASVASSPETKGSQAKMTKQNKAYVLGLLGIVVAAMLGGLLAHIVRTTSVESSAPTQGVSR